MAIGKQNNRRVSHRKQRTTFLPILLGFNTEESEKKSEKTIEKQTFRVFQLKEGWTETKLIINKDYYHEQLHSSPSQWAFVLFERCCRLK